MELLTHVLLSGKEYPINYDFRVAMECDKILNDPSISDEERGARVTGLLFGMDSPYTQEALDKVGIFLTASNVYEGEDNQEKLLDFEQHFDLFYSAFKASYNIDLYTDDIHYHQFISLLKGLKNQVLNDVVEILTMKPSEEKDFKRRQQLIKAQNSFKIKDKNVNKEPPKHEFMKALKVP